MNYTLKRTTLSLYIILTIIITLSAENNVVSSMNLTTTTSYPVAVYNAFATQCQQGGELINAIDGDLTTMYHSDWGGESLPDTLDFNFVQIPRIDSLIYYPRIDNCTNGYFGQTEIWYASNDQPTAFTKLMDKNFGELPNVSSVALNGSTGLLNPSTVRLIVKTGKNNFASCAEMKFRTNVPIPLVSNCDPAVGLTSDQKQTIFSGSSSSFQSGFNINKSFDGDMTTLYHSNYNGGGFPINLNYNFSNVDKIDYLIYRPRNDSGTDGLFQNTEIWYSTIKSPTTFIKVCNFNFGCSPNDTKVVFPSSILTPATIRIIVNSGFNNFASCAEMEFYSYSLGNNFPDTIFQDSICSGIKANVKQTDIDGMVDGFYKNLAQCMFNGTYKFTNRIQTYVPYPNVDSTASALKTNTYSQFENATGIHFENNSKAVILVGNTYGQSISLKVFDYGTQTSINYPLFSGMNNINISAKGLGYIDYYSDNYASLKPIKIHITSGKINGCFDVQTSTADSWKTLLLNTVDSMINLKGKYIDMLYPVLMLKQYTDDGKKLMQVYDSIVHVEQGLMGLYKYNKVPKNHMYAEADNNQWNWYQQDGLGAHFSGGCDATCRLATLDYWGIAHELGHVNQIVPALRWAGTTEVTNNIYSAWVQYLFTPTNTRIEKELLNDAYYNGFETGTGNGVGNNIIGGRFNAYLNNGLLKRQKWMFQYGPDSMTDSGAEPNWQGIDGGDLFLRFCPLWQLELYYQVAYPEKKDWFGDVAEKVRNTNQSGLSNGTMQLNFIKNTCDAVGEDLTDFFTKIGMLRVVSSKINDYEVSTISITKADSIATVAYIAGKAYPKPASPVLYYISANNVNAFKNKLLVQGTQGLGCTPKLSSNNDYENYVIVDHAIWKNVCVFETNCANKLIRISMVGSGFQNNDKTRVYYPANATSIFAVSWDGTKKLVFESTTGFPSNFRSEINISFSPIKNTLQLTGIECSSFFTLMNVSGKILMQKQINNNEDIVVGDLTRGVYLVNIINSSGTYSFKFLK